MEGSTLFDEKRQLVEIVETQSNKVLQHEAAQTGIMDYLNSLRFVQGKVKKMIIQNVTEIIAQSNDTKGT